MKKIKLLIIFILLVSFNANFIGASTPKMGNLVLLVWGFHKNSGQIKFALHNTPDTYLSRTRPAFRRGKIPVRDKYERYVFRNIPYGEYSITLYHDENGNGDFDCTSMGLPAEPYGFSNNVRRTLAPPSFEKSKFTFDKASLTISIEVK